MYIETPIVKAIKGKMASAKSLEHLTQMNFSSFKMTAIPDEAKKLLEKCTSLYELNFTGCGLQSLDNLPNLELSILILGNNSLKDQELKKLAIYQKSLQILTLSKNNLQSISYIGFFSSFPRLSQLNLEQNPFCDQYVSYSRKIFDEILYKNDQLTLIDHYQRNGSILQEDDGKDLDMDQEEWMICSQQWNRGSGEQQESIQSDEIAQKIDPNQISLYQQYPYKNSQYMAELLNQHEMGLMEDPYFTGIEDDMDMEEDAEEEGFKCILTKKIKYNQENYNDDMDY